VVDDFVYPDSRDLLAGLAGSTGPRFRALNKVVADLVDGYGMVAFAPLDISDEGRCAWAWSDGGALVCASACAVSR